MLAERFDKQARFITYPAYVQPKLDGMRAMYNPNANDFTSRSGLPACTTCTTIKNELKSANGNTLNLDGELYSRGYSFQNVMKLVHSNDPNLMYHVYDYSGTNDSYEVRLNKLKSFFIKNPQFKHIKFVETFVVHNAQDVKRYHDKFKAEGYEGAIVRNAHAQYQSKRTNDLQKVKEFQDAEFRVTGFVSDSTEHVLWECATTSGKTFRVKPSNTDDAAKQGLSKAQKFVGRMYTVQFQELTDGGIPRFPVGLGFKHSSDIGMPYVAKPQIAKPHIAEAPIAKPQKRPSVIDDSDEEAPKPKKQKSPPKKSPPKPKKSPPKKSPPKPKKSPPKPKKSPPKKSPSNDTGCVIQTTAKYVSRDSPPYPGNKCCNRELRGNDGNMWVSKPNTAGICSWKKK